MTKRKFKNNLLDTLEPVDPNKIAKAAEKYNRSVVANRHDHNRAQRMSEFHVKNERLTN